MKAWHFSSPFKIMHSSRAALVSLQTQQIRFFIGSAWQEFPPSSRLFGGCAPCSSAIFAHGGLNNGHLSEVPAPRVESSSPMPSAAPADTDWDAPMESLRRDDNDQMARRRLQLLRTSTLKKCQRGEENGSRYLSLMN